MKTIKEIIRQASMEQEQEERKLGQYSAPLISMESIMEKVLSIQRREILEEVVELLKLRKKTMINDIDGWEKGNDRDIAQTEIDCLIPRIEELKKQIEEKEMKPRRTIREADNCHDCDGKIRVNGRDEEGFMTYICEKCHQIYYNEREL